MTALLQAKAAQPCLPAARSLLLHCHILLLAGLCRDAVCHRCYTKPGPAQCLQYTIQSQGGC